MHSFFINFRQLTYVVPLFCKSFNNSLILMHTDYSDASVAKLQNVCKKMYNSFIFNKQHAIATDQI